jgi:Kef-type K+ transport system membrane component KefB
MAGLYFAPSRVGPATHGEMKMILTALTSGVLGPLFFVSIGLRVDLGTVTAVPLFLSLLIAVAFLGKMAGAGLPALWVGLGRREALAVGVGMSARGAVELVVISIAYEAGLFAPPGVESPVVTHLFSSLILVAVVTTLLTPIVLRRILPKTKD